MEINIPQILEQLNLLASSTEIEVTKLIHEPMTGGYLGFVTLEGVKNNFSIFIRVTLDFPIEDGISLSINPLTTPSGEVMDRLRLAVEQMRNDFHTPLEGNWVSLLAREIRVRTDLYN